jgi:hypothetical protein
VFAQLSARGEVCFYASVDTDLIADINGWFSHGSGFTPLHPQRVVDTRPGEPAGAVVVAKQRYGGPTTLTVGFASHMGVPTSGIGAVALNVTAVDPVGAGFVTLFPCGDRPLASNLNFLAGETVPNLVIAPVSGTGAVCVFSSVDTHLVIDVVGWFAAGSDFVGLVPQRLIDTRPSEPHGSAHAIKQRYGRANVLAIKVAGAGGIPENHLRAVSLNVTAVDPAGAGFVTVYPCGTPPLVSHLNFVAGAIQPNLVIAPVSPAGEVCIFASVDTHLLADVNGWFVSE